MKYDIKIFYLEKRNGQIIKAWHKWKKISECSVEELKQANQRELKPDEIVLDYEDLESSVKGIKKIYDGGYNFEVWDTGSRGYHVHLNFPKLSSYSEEERKLIRERFIKDCAADLAKRGGLIAKENKPHFKTGKTKRLIQHYNKDNNNKLPSEYTSSVEMLQQPTKIEDKLDSKEIRSILEQNPKILANVKQLDSENKPVDRSSKDFSVIKCLLENGFSKMQIYKFLKSLRFSKIQTDGWSYFNFSYKNCLRIMCNG